MSDLFEGCKSPFRIWSILDIPSFIYEGNTIPFPPQHRIVFAYMASLANRYGDVRVSYYSVCKRTGLDEIEEAAAIFKWLEAFGLIKRRVSLFEDDKGKKEATRYLINYPENKFPYPTLSPTMER
ncbi:hypothetical protein QQX82_27135 [Klebsiella variicola]|uniref:hypothetical protein n=1 Tax=Klebsiella variicola TaxID=244366 RepID=UPI00352706AD